MAREAVHVIRIKREQPPHRAEWLYGQIYVERGRSPSDLETTDEAPPTQCQTHVHLISSHRIAYQTCHRKTGSGEDRQKRWRRSIIKDGTERGVDALPYLYTSRAIKTKKKKKKDPVLARTMRKNERVEEKPKVKQYQIYIYIYNNINNNNNSSSSSSKSENGKRERETTMKQDE